MSVTLKSGATSDLATVEPTSKALRIWPYNAAGTAVESVSEGGHEYLGVAIRQDVHASTSNSSVANIANGVTWEGTEESSLGVAGIQVNTYIDRPHTIYVDQGPGSGVWRLTDSWHAPSSFGVSRTVQATDAAFRVRVTNDGGTTSTVTQISTALCPVVEALPRALTSGGNLKVSINADWQDSRTVTGLYAATTFATIGSAASPQNLLTIENPAANTNNIVIRDITVMSDSTALLATLSPRAILSKPASLPTGGTALTAVKYKTSYASATAIVRGATNADGAALTAITATAGTGIWTQFLDRAVTLVGFVPHTNYRMVPDVGADLRQLILVPGESALVQIVGTAAATTLMICNIAWTEYMSL